MVTKGATGNGECTAKLLSDHGTEAAIADVQDEYQAICCRTNRCLEFDIHCHVTNKDHIQNAGKLDITVNNAGIADLHKPPITENEKADFERVLAVNVTGAFLGMKHSARVMIPLAPPRTLTRAQNTRLWG